jgi:hypothetical protein
LISLQRALHARAWREAMHGVGPMSSPMNRVTQASRNFCELSRGLWDFIHHVGFNPRTGRRPTGTR